MERQKLTSALLHTVLLQPPENAAVSCTCRLPMPPSIRLLPCSDSPRATDEQSCCAPVDLTGRSKFRVDFSFDMALRATSRTNKPRVQHVLATTGVAGRSAFHRAISNSKLLTHRRQWLNVVRMSGSAGINSVRRETLAAERIVRGNAPNIRGSHEKRNADQCSPAGRKPDRRHRG